MHFQPPRRGTLAPDGCFRARRSAVTRARGTPSRSWKMGREAGGVNPTSTSTTVVALIERHWLLGPRVHPELRRGVGEAGAGVEAREQGDARADGLGVPSLAGAG